MTYTYPNHEIAPESHAVRVGGGSPEWVTDVMEARRTGMLAVLGFSKVPYNDGLTEVWKRTEGAYVAYITYERAELSRCAVTLSCVRLDMAFAPITTVRITERIWRDLMDRTPNATLQSRYQ